MDQDVVSWGSVIAGILALISFWGLLRAQRRYRLIKDTPTSKCHGVFMGLVEIEGTAESEAPLVSFLAETRCVKYAWSVKERWSRLVRETYTDSKGNKRTRMRRESGWTTVASDQEVQSFYLQDDTGMVLVHPQDAEIHDVSVFSETCNRSHPLYYAKGPAHSVANSDHVRWFTETAIPLHAPLYIMGHAQERVDIVAPEIVKPSKHPFIVSMRNEASLLSGYRWIYWGLLLLTGALVIGWPILLVYNDVATVSVPICAGLIYVMMLLFSWLWSTYNHLVFLRNRVRQAASLSDVQYKRRHDLIPALVEAVKGMRGHEVETQRLLAALRAEERSQAYAPQLNTLSENYPALRADEAFAKLQHALIDTEDRIALAINYYNDSVTNFNTRIQCFPEKMIASVFHFIAAPLNHCTAFERRNVQVNLEN